MYYLKPMTYEKSIPLSIVLFSSVMTRSINLEYKSQFWYPKIHNIIANNHLSIYIPSESFLVFECLPEKYLGKDSLLSEFFRSLF